MRRWIALLMVLVAVDARAGGQGAFKLNVLHIVSHFSVERDLMVTVRNMSKSPSTVDSVTAEVSADCRYDAAVGLVDPGDVVTVLLATRRQIAACEAPTLKAFKAGEALGIV